MEYTYYGRDRLTHVVIGDTCLMTSEVVDRLNHKDALIAKLEELLIEQANIIEREAILLSKAERRISVKKRLRNAFIGS